MTRDAHGQRVVTIDGTTDHGGTIKTAFDTLLHGGRPVTGEGHWVWCPKCKGDFRILPSPSGRRHMGRTIAHEGTLTECGARLLAAPPLSA